MCNKSECTRCIEMKKEIEIYRNANIRLHARVEIESMKRKKAEENEKDAIEKSNLDPLTNLLHKISFREAGSHLFAFAKRRHIPLTALYIDLNDFSEINNKYGHRVGDNVLKEVSALFKSLLREADIIGRDGGDEFFALLIDTNYESAKNVSLKIKYALEKYSFHSKGKEFFLNAAVGVVEFKEEMDDLEELIECVDEEMYKIKNNMKNCS